MTSASSEHGWRLRRLVHTEPYRRARTAAAGSTDFAASAWGNSVAAKGRPAQCWFGWPWGYVISQPGSADTEFDSVTELPAVRKTLLAN